MTETQREHARTRTTARTAPGQVVVVVLAALTCVALVLVALQFVTVTTLRVAGGGTLPVVSLRQR